MRGNSMIGNSMHKCLDKCIGCDYLIVDVEGYHCTYGEDPNERYIVVYHDITDCPKDKVR